MRMTTVYLVDDHDVVIRGLEAALNKAPRIEVIGGTNDSLTAVEEVIRLRPDILILDLMMPGLSGNEILRQVQEASVHTKVLVLSMHKEIAYVAEALRRGAMGYAVKDINTDELVEAIWRIMDDEIYLSPPFNHDDIKAYLRQEKSVNDEYEELTRREREILSLVAQGETTQAIANQLGIKLRTAEHYRYHTRCASATKPTSFVLPSNGA
ncbi:MAG: response regulator transcription factor [Chloroflexi bacterium]|nr:response regulator transcription factor [Chloroflexota bacterium]